MEKMQLFINYSWIYLHLCLWVDVCVLYIIFPRVSVCLCGDNKLQIYFYFIIILFYYLYNFNSLLLCRVYCTHLQNCFYFNSHSFSAKKNFFWEQIWTVTIEYLQHDCVEWEKVNINLSKIKYTMQQQIKFLYFC